MYSQGKEEEVIVKFFNGRNGTLLSIGENDGKTFSNSLRLIELGWDAVLVEPSPVAFQKMFDLHKDNKKVCMARVAIGIVNGKGVLHESGHHLPNQSDVALLSSLKKEETVKWKRVDFKEQDVDVLDFKTFQTLVPKKNYDFITIDAEGMDIEILKQINLSKTHLLCIEYNENVQAKDEIIKYCAEFGMCNLLYQSGENLIISR
ncbi:MAG: hypothetical protein K0S44_204 [Bacteroidetes bacterium]|jgi:FkbM family methyltransferase|nr:hypothetical protein [Bacteroidota bacterium]